MPRTMEHWERFRALVAAGEISLDPGQSLSMRKIGKKTGVKVGWISPGKDMIQAAYRDFHVYQRLWDMGIDFYDRDGMCK